MSHESTKSVEDLVEGDMIQDPEFTELVEVTSVHPEEEHVIVHGRIFERRKVELIYAKGHPMVVHAA